MSSFIKVLLFCCGLFCTVSLRAQPVELVFWHGLAGHLGDEVQRLADQFNQGQKEYFIKPVYKGNYVETFTSFAAAFRAHHPPAIVQIFEVGTAMMSSPKGVIKPVSELMQEQNMVLPQQDFFPSIREFYSNDGQLLALPFNSSTPTLYYNQDALAKIGYSKTNFPKTWEEMETLAVKLKHAGYDCAYTSAYPGWILFESFLSIHGLALTQNNPLQAAFDTPQLRRHFARLKRWNDAHYFRYAGRDDDATILFTSGVCPLFSQSSGSYNSLTALVPFHLGSASMPLDTEVSKVRHANIVGGAALWAVAGQTQKEYKGIMQFFAFIAQPKIQRQWHERTGYLPLGVKGVYASMMKSSHHPSLWLAQTELQGEAQEQPLKNFGPQNQIRSINDEVLEAMFAGILSPEEAVHEAALRVNRLLVRFVRNTQEK